MDLIDILTKVNKAALFFFLATIAFLAYEFYLFRKERSKKKGIKVPQFGAAPSPAAPPPVIAKTAQPVAHIPPMTKKRNNKRAAVVIGATVIALGLTGAIAYRLVSTPSQEASVAPVNPSASDETVATDLSTTDESSTSAVLDNTATSGAALESTDESTDSALLAAGVSPSPAAQPTSTPTATPEPTDAIASDESMTLTDEEATASAIVSPTGVSTLPLTADAASMPYTLFIFLAAIITFFVAFIY